MMSETPWALPATGLARTRAAWILFAAAALLAAPVLPQNPTAGPGFACTAVLWEATQVPLVRCWWRVAERSHLLAVGPRLHLVGDSYQPANPLTPPPVLDVGPGDDIAFLAPAAAPGLVLAGAVQSGKVHVVDPFRGLVSTFAGVRNTFDAAPVGNDLLLCANPLWPQAGATTGVWLAGPGRTPRQLIALAGPSGPLVILGNGDLVVAELGPIVPPPPGAARLLRIPAANLQAAIAGGTLTVADVAAVGTGFTGIYDLARDAEDRLHVTDSGGTIVVHTAPGSLSPAGTTLDAGPGRQVLGLQFAAHAAAPLRAYQPPEHSPSLFVATSDFWSRFEVLEIRPARPGLAIAPSPVVARGTSTLAVGGGPPAGLALVLASMPSAGPEVVVATLEGTPLWIGLSQASAFPVAAVGLGPTGAASIPLLNPGGVPGRIDLQVAALGAPGSGALGSSPVLPLSLLP
jgi:hypothetical protein